MYDIRTIDQLRWLHGDARASAIVLGNDARTNADLASWGRLGGRTPTSLDQRFELGIKLVSQGYSVADAAFMADVGEHALKSSLTERTRR